METNGGGHENLSKLQKEALEKLQRLDIEFTDKRRGKRKEYFQKREEIIKQALPGIDDAVDKFRKITDKDPYDDDLPDEAMEIMRPFEINPLLFVEHWKTKDELDRSYKLDDQKKD